MRSEVTRLALAAALVAACARSDGAVEARVKDRLAQESTAPAQIHVSSKERIVTLQGVVNSEQEKSRIAEAARSVDGVLGIDDRLVVQSPVQVTGANDIAFNADDRAVKDAVRKRLDEARVRGAAVEVHDRIVTLHGQVPADQREAAVGAAMGAPGVRRVDDKLELR
jgi:osmotically-inducible protein OsmY